MTLTRNAAASLARYRIRVNQINVGWTLTEGEERVKREEEHDPDWLSAAVATRPFGRLLLPHDIALAAEYFASDAQRTGHRDRHGPGAVSNRRAVDLVAAWRRA